MSMKFGLRDGAGDLDSVGEVGSLIEGISFQATGSLMRYLQVSRVVGKA